MAAPPRDPYQTLGVGPGVSDAELRAAYRKLVIKHHPDHNNGSVESARRFEEVQEAYARIRELRASGAGAAQRGASPPRPRTRARQPTSPPPPTETFDPDIEARAAALERELAKARLAQERARQAAREAAQQAARAAARQAGERTSTDRPDRPSDEELGYIRTDDSFSKIIADARDELADKLSGATDKLSGAHEHPVVKRVSDMLDELEALAGKLTGERSDRTES